MGKTDSERANEAEIQRQQQEAIQKRVGQGGRDSNASDPNWLARNQSTQGNGTPSTGGGCAVAGIFIAGGILTSLGYVAYIGISRLIA